MGNKLTDELENVVRVVGESIEKLNARQKIEWEKATPEERKAAKNFIDNNPYIKEAREKAKAAGFDFPL